MTSVSVWLAKTNPCDSSSRRSDAWFSITPLWTTATLAAPPRPPRCGMGIAVGGRAVRRPSRVADPAAARRRLVLEQLLQGAHPPGALPHDRADPGRWSPGRRCRNRDTRAGEAPRPGSARPHDSRYNPRSRTWLPSLHHEGLANSARSWARRSRRPLSVEIARFPDYTMDSASADRFPLEKIGPPGSRSPPSDWVIPVVPWNSSRHVVDRTRFST